MDDILIRVGKQLITHKLSIAVAESATAGQLMAELSLIEDAGNFLRGGVVCYDARVKEGLLKVDHVLITKCTPESMEVTKAITEGLRNVIPADIYIGVTGLTCPGGSETPEKPVGTMFVYGLHDGARIFSARLNFSGTPGEIVKQTILQTGLLVEHYLNKLSE